MLMSKIITNKQYIYGILTIIVMTLLGFVIIPQLASFNSTLGIVSTANALFVVAAIVVSLLPSVFGALLYGSLSLKRLKLSSTLIVQLSGLLVNRIVPAGIGGLGLNIWYLQNKKHTIAQATTVVGFNNFIGIIGNVLLLLIAVVISVGVFEYNFAVTVRVLWIVALCIVILITIFFVLRQKARTFICKVYVSIKQMWQHFNDKPMLFIYALLLSCSMTLASATAFWLCCYSVDISISLATSLIILSLGVIVGTAVPTPGGLGGVEAALVAALIGLSVMPELALAATLVYRLSSYWIGLLLGAMALIELRRRTIQNIL